MASSGSDLEWRGRWRAAWSGCVPGKLPAKVIVAPNSPSARAHASTAPATRPGRMGGSVTRRNTYQRDAPSVRAASSKRRSICAERRLDGEHEERHGDEGLGHDHARGRERQADAEPAVEVLADEAAPAERVEQGDAADDGWQHHRQGARARAPCRGPGNATRASSQASGHAEEDRRAPSPTASTRARGAAP